MGGPDASLPFQPGALFSTLLLIFHAHLLSLGRPLSRGAENIHRTRAARASGKGRFQFSRGSRPVIMEGGLHTRRRGQSAGSITEEEQERQTRSLEPWPSKSQLEEELVIHCALVRTARGSPCPGSTGYLSLLLLPPQVPPD